MLLSVFAVKCKNHSLCSKSSTLTQAYEFGNFSPLVKALFASLKILFVPSPSVLLNYKERMCLRCKCIKTSCVYPKLKQEELICCVWISVFCCLWLLVASELFFSVDNMDYATLSLNGGENTHLGMLYLRC